MSLHVLTLAINRINRALALQLPMQCLLSKQRVFCRTAEE